MGPRTVRLVKWAGWVETIPEKDGGPAERQVKELEVDVVDVDQAQAMLKGLAGPGWRLLSVRRI